MTLSQLSGNTLEIKGFILFTNSIKEIIIDKGGWFLKSHWLSLDEVVFTLTDDKKYEKKILDPPVAGACAIFVPRATFWGQKFFGLRFYQFWCQKICISKTKTEQKTRNQNIDPGKSY